MFYVFYFIILLVIVKEKYFFCHYWDTWEINFTNIAMFWLFLCKLSQGEKSSLFNWQSTEFNYFEIDQYNMHINAFTIIEHKHGDPFSVKYNLKIIITFRFFRMEKYFSSWKMNIFLFLIKIVLWKVISEILTIFSY